MHFMFVKTGGSNSHKSTEYPQSFGSELVFQDRELVNF